MTERSIEELANEVAAEESRDLRGFLIEHVDDVDGALRITFCWREPYRIDITINLNDNDTDESVKAEIRWQLRQE
jgi:hypothetical protein